MSAIARRFGALAVLIVGGYVGLAVVLFIGVPTLVLRGSNAFWRVADFAFGPCEWAAERLS